MMLIPMLNRGWKRLQEWHNTALQRRQLRGLSDRMLKDIGLSRADAEREARRPFWETGPSSDRSLRRRATQKKGSGERAEAGGCCRC